ncbi:cell surface glycoprotein CD200 receptor 1-like [Bufo gargarizans]|uniref:cell surface glycoprotein CD200 receptor 1-like n=1 Tax=Bufo gargarizans TaxID=30331 RepID=UPI001CF22963|nr:cell surface glycoprotein CD200 receptor 1-like [Bufo gargarizans]
MEHLQSIRFLLSLVLLYTGAASSDVVRVRRGRPVVLQCEAGDTMISVIWKLDLYNSSCVIGYKIEGYNKIPSYSSCSTRMRSYGLSLRISNAEVSDEGLYACKDANTIDTVFTYKVLQVLAEPSTFLKLNSDGSPECGAVGGNPPAEISWIPHSDDITTTILEEPDQTRTVISTIHTESLNETSVMCVVSHPMFLTPWTGVISLTGKGFKLRLDNIVRLIVTIIVTILLAGHLLYLKIKRQKENIPGKESIEA